MRNPRTLPARCALWVGLCCAVAWLACWNADGPAAHKGSNAMQEIVEDGQRYEIGSGERWGRDYLIEEKTFLYLIVEQLGADVSIILSGPEGFEEFTADSPIGSFGEEELVATLDPGQYRIEVVAEGGAPVGEFRLRTVARRAVAAGDEAHVAADRDHREGWRLHSKEKDYGQAIEHYRRALLVWTDQDRPRREATTLDGLYLAYGKLEKEEIAYALLQRAIERGRLESGLHDQILLAKMLNRAGVFEHRKLARAAESIGYFNEAIAIAERLGNQEALSSYARNRGRSFFELGLLQPALDDFELALETTLNPGKKMKSSIDRVHVLLAMHSPREALAEASSGRQTAEATENRLLSARLALLQARASVQTNALEQAVQFVAEARPVLRDLKRPKLVTNALLILGDIHRRQGQRAIARETFEEALAIARDLEDSKREATLLVEIGYLDLLGDDPASGLRRIDRALVTFRELGDARAEASALARSAEALRELGQLDDAASRIEAALETVERQRASTAREDVRMDFFEFRQEYYEIALDIELRRWQEEPTPRRAEAALQLHERRLAREARDKVLWRTLAIAAPSEWKERTRQRAIEAELASVTSSSSLSPARRDQETDRLLARLAKAQSHARRGRTGSPPASLLDLESIRQGLDEETTVLIYALGPTQSCLWTLTRSAGLSLAILPLLRDQVAARTDSWREAMLSGRTERRKDSTRLGQALTKVLLAPVLDRLEQRKLVLVPDGALHTLPFAALPLPDVDGHVRYLVQEAEVSILPSLSMLPALRLLAQSRPSGPRPAAIFADAVYNQKDPRLSATDHAHPPRSGSTTAPNTRAVERAMSAAGLDGLARLEASAREAADLLDRMPVSGSFLATDFTATKTTVQELDLGQYALLHFAVHALVDNERPDLSGLVLSLVDRQGEAQDGFLRGFEIATLSTTAELVVLSACETGHGRLVAGEGILGLTRRFFDAGAIRVLATLWRVSDRHTATLMRHFYEGFLVAKLPPAEALRQAQLALLSDPATNDPYYWAGFSLQGDRRRPEGW